MPDRAPDPSEKAIDAASSIVAVAIDVPKHAAIGSVLHYSASRPVTPGTLVRVPLARGRTAGIVWPAAAAADPALTLRPLDAIVEALPALSPAWLGLVDFAAGYYQRAVGELALAVVPPELRRLDPAQIAQRIVRTAKAMAAWPAPAHEPVRPGLSDEQQDAIQRIDAAAAGEAFAVLLHGVTGSGKTEVYLRIAERVLAEGRQVLVLVPEINLTPQLEARFAERFAGRRIVPMHSALTPAQRLGHWLAAHLGLADLVLGTRLAVFASMPRLGLIVVDEEHDASYKQQEGARYSARDLAVYRGRLEKVRVILGSATPSLETWQRALQGRYLRVALTRRIACATLPQVRLFDMSRLRRPQAGRSPRESPAPLAPPIVERLRERIERGEQGLLLLNRRGYAPVLHCEDCGWKSECAHCSAWRVFHKADRSLRCHHCGFTEPVPRACPDCGNADIAAIGRGTERLEEQLAELLPQARIGRIDADTTRRSGALQSQLAAVHEGAVDVIVGTQMIAKGHDFRRVTLVVAVNPDAALFAGDFRAPERLFALLMQAAGRAGRDASLAAASEMWIQTWHPRHPLFAALREHDYEAFASAQLAERQAAGMPPFTHLALLRADARAQEAARAFLQAAAAAMAPLAGAQALTLYPPVPLPIARVADVERMQMLVECASRPLLQRLLAQWLPQLHALRATHRVLRWAIDVDPLAI